MRRTTTETTDERAVSEVIAFILVFAIILGSVGFLYVVGFDSMQTYQENEQLGNAERAMDAMADNFNDVARYDGIESRSGELSARGGTVRASAESTNLTIEDEDGSFELNGEPLEDIELGILEYEAGGEVISYEGGGVFKGSDDYDGSVTLSEPMLKCGDETAIITVVQIDVDQERSLTADGLVEIDVDQVDATRTTKSVDGNVSISVDEDSPTNEMAWDRSIEEAGLDDCAVDRVSIHLVTIEVDY